MRSRRVPAVSSSVTRGTASGLGVVAAQPALGARARHVGVQGEADGVEQAGLARAGGAVDEEEALRPRARRRRRRPGRRTARTPRSRAGAPSRGPRRAGRDRAHDPSSSPTWRATRLASTASASRARSSSLAPRPPRTWARKSQQTSTSVAVATRAAYGRSGTARALRVEAQLEGVREAAAHLVHGAERALRVGEGDLAPRALGAAVARGRRAARRGCRAARRAAGATGASTCSTTGRCRRRGRRAGCPCGASPLGERHRDGGPAVADAGRRPPGGRGGGRARRSRRRRRPRAARRTTPPTEMSRSDSLVTPPVTKAWAMTTTCARRAARRPRAPASMAARRTPAWVRSVAPRASAARAGSR